MWRGQKGREVVESSDDKAKPTRADGKGSLRGCDSGHGFQGHCRERRSRFDRVQRDMRHLCTRAVSQLHTPHHHPPPSLQEGGKCQNAVVSRTPNSRQGQLEDVIDLRIPRKWSSLPYKPPLFTPPHTAPHSMSKILLRAIHSFRFNQKAHQTHVENFEKYRFQDTTRDSQIRIARIEKSGKCIFVKLFHMIPMCGQN